MMVRFFFFSLFLFSLSSFSEVLEREVILDTDSKALAGKEASKEVSIELVKEMIGEKKYEKNQDKIDKSILSESFRYILSSQASSPETDEEGKFVFVVKLQVSQENLKKLLLKHDLFYESSGSSCLLPVVSFQSHFKEKKKFNWWEKEKTEEKLKNKKDKKPENFNLKNLAGEFFEKLQTALVFRGFYVLNPVSLKLSRSTPSFALPKGKIKPKKFEALAKYHDCDIVFYSYVQMGKLKKTSSALLDFFSFFSPEESNFEDFDNAIQFYAQIFNIKNYQSLFKVSKSYPLKEEAVEEEILSKADLFLDSVLYQLVAYHEEGSLGLDRVSLSLQGPLSYMEKEQLKNLLIKHTKGLQNLEVAFLSSSRVIYAAESSSSVKELSRELKSLSIPGFAIKLKGFKKREIAIYAKKTSLK